MRSIFSIFDRAINISKIKINSTKTMYKTLQELLAEGHLENMLSAEIADKAEANSKESEQEGKQGNLDID